MPTPLEILLDPVSLIVLAIYGVLMIWEALFPARQLPKIKFWKLRGLTAFAFFFYLSSYLPLFTDPYLEPYRLLDATGLGTLGGGLLGVLLYEFGVYVWHRALHKSDLLWRTFHQMHHSAERLDTYGAFYFSPLDMVGWTILGSVCFALLVGLSPQAITVTLLVTNFLGMFQHANIKTPRWLGYIVQRPESHTVHHAKGIHKHNYSDLPIFDILFGTFENPRHYEHQTGFYYGASAKVLDMLTFKDLNKERTKQKEKNVLSTKAKKVFSILLILSLIVGCSKDNPEIITPDPVGQTPEEPIEDTLVPVLNSINPSSGPKATIVTIDGDNFGTDPEKVTVFFNDIEAVIQSVTSTVITTVVPPRAFTGKVTLVVDGSELVGPEFNYVISDTLVRTLAGSIEGFSDGLGTAARFDTPTGIAIDANGNTYVADPNNNRIRKITPDGLVTTLAGGSQGSEDGTGSAAEFDAPWDVDVDALGNVYVVDANNHRIRKITPDGIVTTVAGSTQGLGNGPAATAQFNYPRGITVSPDGIIYVADTGNGKIRQIDTQGNTITLYSGLQSITGIELSPNGELYFVDSNAHELFKLNIQNNVVSRITGDGEGDKNGYVSIAQFRYPRDIAVDAKGNLFIADEGNHKIRKIDTNGNVTTYAGSVEGYLEGAAHEAQFNLPYGIGVDNEGTIYIADTSNNSIRKIVQE